MIKQILRYLRMTWLFKQIFHYVQYDMDIEYKRQGTRDKKQETRNKRQGTRAKAPVIPTRSEESLRIVSKYYTDYNLRLLYLQLIYLLLF